MVSRVLGIVHHSDGCTLRAKSAVDAHIETPGITAQISAA